MESLAAAAAAVMLSIVGVSFASLVAGVWRLPVLALAAAPLSAAAGLWLAVTIPHAWPLAAWCVGVATWSAWRLAWR